MLGAKRRCASQAPASVSGAKAVALRPRSGRGVEGSVVSVQRVEITLSHRGCTVTGASGAGLVLRRRPVASSAQVSSEVGKKVRSVCLGWRGELRAKGRKRSRESIWALRWSDGVVAGISQSGSLSGCC